MLIHYDDRGRVIQMQFLNKDGLAAYKMIELSYPDNYTWKIKETGERIDGIDFHFNANGTLDHTYKYRILPSHPTIPFLPRYLNFSMIPPTIS